MGTLSNERTSQQTDSADRHTRGVRTTPGPGAPQHAIEPLRSPESLLEPPTTTKCSKTGRGDFYASRTAYRASHACGRRLLYWESSEARGGSRKSIVTTSGNWPQAELTKALYMQNSSESESMQIPSAAETSTAKSYRASGSVEPTERSGSVSDTAITSSKESQIGNKSIRFRYIE